MELCILAILAECPDQLQDLGTTLVGHQNAVESVVKEWESLKVALD